MGPIRQGDVILLPIAKILGDELPHLTLVEGISTGHSHRISQGVATLFSHNGDRYLRVRSKYAILSHDEHRSLKVRHGNWKVFIQREYVPQRNGNTAVQPDFGTSEYGDAAFFEEVFAQVQASSQEELLASALSYQAKSRQSVPTSSTSTTKAQPQSEVVPSASKKTSRNWQYVVD